MSYLLKERNTCGKFNNIGCQASFHYLSELDRRDRRLGAETSYINFCALFNVICNVLATVRSQALALLGNHFQGRLEQDSGQDGDTLRGGSGVSAAGPGLYRPLLRGEDHVRVQQAVQQPRRPRRPRRQGPRQAARLHTPAPGGGGAGVLQVS